ncbi:MAG: hypothetical protein GXN95_01980 [Methanococci archaeon]|nr:hypothetical protein [Methanococci archaeon]
MIKLFKYIDKFKDLDFLNAVKTYKLPILSKLRSIFEEDIKFKKEYNEDLQNYSTIYQIDVEKLDELIDFLLIVILSHTPYFNAFIRRYSEIKKSEIAKDLKNYERVWEFITIASRSGNNDLHLERLDLERGVVNIKDVKEIYAREIIRVEVKKLGEMAKKVPLPDDSIIKNILDEITSYLKEKIKYKAVESIQAPIYEGEIPFDWHPPCIRGILNDILSGGSPSHYARRSFVVYWFCARFNPNLRPLDKDGNIVNVSATDIASEEEIERFVDELIEMLFKNVEDFNEKKTRYYIMHNIGYKVGHGRLTHCEYCKNWKNDNGKGLNHYCNPDEICRKREIKHPLDYLCYNINLHLKNKVKNVKNEKIKENLKIDEKAQKVEERVENENRQ